MMMTDGIGIGIGSGGGIGIGIGSGILGLGLAVCEVLLTKKIFLEVGSGCWRLFRECGNVTRETSEGWRFPRGESSP